eukprot:s580_g4.t1
MFFFVLLTCWEVQLLSDVMCRSQRAAAADDMQVEDPDLDALFGEGFSDSNIMQFQSDLFSEHAYTEQLQSDACEIASGASAEIGALRRRPMADIFNFSQDPSPRCPDIAEIEPEVSTGGSDTMQEQLNRFLMPEDAKCVHAVKSLQDLSYFDGKSQKLELACGQWLNLLSIDWSSSGVGPHWELTPQRDHTGTEAFSILKACFGVKSPSTLLKRRLLGFAALERQAMGPTKQAPGMELEHLRRLREILASGANLIDKLGAGCFLLCTYARARWWSDLRFVERVHIEAGDLTLYTAEHKTASVGIRRQQYLPLVVPWHEL